ncbi:MAG: hypothetical protein JWQ38_200 [Flavipsychrobacter sp.]|nr:hypothetical protein [Flavipsychrobacter sp.]
MDKGQTSLKKYSSIALAALAVQVILSVIFYKERVFFADASFVLFNVINKAKVFVLNDRWGSFITELPPYLFIKLHLPIKQVIFAYALSFNSFVMIIAAAIAYLHKQYKLVILLALYSFLFASDSFFFLADTHVGIAWMFLFFSVTLYLRDKQFHILVISIPFAILLYLAVTTHFIIIIPTVFLWVYLIADNNNWPFSRNNTIFLSLLFIAIIASKFLLVNPVSYDSDHLKGVKNISLKSIPEAFGKPELIAFYYRCLNNYWWSVIVFILSAVYLVRSKKYILLSWFLASVTGYFILIGITYGDPNSNILLCHVELEWISLGIIVSVPFVFQCLPNINFRLGIGILVLVFVTRTIYICNSMAIVKKREQEKSSILNQMKKKGIHKLALLEMSYTQSKYLITWAIPYESLLKSAMNKDKPLYTFCFINRDHKVEVEILKTQNGFWNSYGVDITKDLNTEYFNVDTVQKNYTIMEESDFYN